MKLKETCCRKYEKGKKACKRCPIMAQLSKKRRKKLLAKHRKKKERHESPKRPSKSES